MFWNRKLKMPKALMLPAIPATDLNSCQSKTSRGHHRVRKTLTAVAATLPITWPATMALAPHPRLASTMDTMPNTIVGRMLTSATRLNCSRRRRRPRCTIPAELAISTRPMGARTHGDSVESDWCTRIGESTRKKAPQATPRTMFTYHSVLRSRWVIRLVWMMAGMAPMSLNVSTNITIVRA